MYPNNITATFKIQKLQEGEARINKNLDNVMLFSKWLWNTL